MDQIEKKMRAHYEQEKQENEKFIPSFDAFRNKLEQVKVVKHSFLLLKVAASVVLLLATGFYYFYTARRPAKEMMVIDRVNIIQNLPTQSLLDKNAGTGNIWNWKAPTDKLLHEAIKSLNPQIKI